MIIKILITFVPGLVLLAFFIVYWRRRAEKRGQHTLRVEDIERGIESWGGGSQPCATCTGGDCCSEPLKTHKRQPEYYDDEELDRFRGRFAPENRFGREPFRIAFIEVFEQRCIALVKCVRSVVVYVVACGQIMIEAR